MAYAPEVLASHYEAKNTEYHPVQMSGMTENCLQN
jgi:hypothetical protein